MMDRIRLHEGLNLTGFAEACKVHPRVARRWLRGERPPRSQWPAILQLTGFDCQLRYDPTPEQQAEIERKADALRARLTDIAKRLGERTPIAAHSWHGILWDSIGRGIDGMKLLDRMEKEHLTDPPEDAPEDTPPRIVKRDHR